jgi:hypothetical protein
VVLLVHGDGHVRFGYKKIQFLSFSELALLLQTFGMRDIHCRNLTGSQILACQSMGFIPLTYKGIILIKLMEKLSKLRANRRERKPQNITHS